MRQPRAKPGDRIRLIRCTDTYERLEPGLLGTVWNVDDAGTVHVNWDNGKRLGLVPDGDMWEIV